MFEDNDKGDMLEAFAVIVLVIGVFAGLLFIASSARAEPNEPIRVCWEAPTQDLAGNPLSPEEISHYEIEHGSALYQTPDLHYDLTLTTYGEHCLRVRAYHVIEHVRPGAWSVSKCIDVIAPPAAVQIRDDCDEVN